MEIIKIIWLRESDRMERASYEVPVAGMVEASRIMSAMIDVVREKEGEKN